MPYAHAIELHAVVWGELVTELFTAEVDGIETLEIVAAEMLDATFAWDVAGEPEAAEIVENVTDLDVTGEPVAAEIVENVTDWDVTAEREAVEIAVNVADWDVTAGPEAAEIAENVADWGVTDLDVGGEPVTADIVEMVTGADEVRAELPHRPHVFGQYFHTGLELHL